MSALPARAADPPKPAGSKPDPKALAAPIAEAEIGHRSATLCHLGVIAIRLGRKLQWDPGQEQFVGDREALTFDPVNVWAGTLLAAAALDLGRQHTGDLRR